MKVCPKCGSARTYLRVRSNNYRCRKCQSVFSAMVHVVHRLPVGRITAFERDYRLQKIRSVHQEHPEYKRRDLRMVCFETAWMVDRYWKKYCTDSVQHDPENITIVKTV